MPIISRLRQPRRLAQAAGATSRAILRRLRYTVSPFDLAAALWRHGIRNGDTIMVHSAFAGMRYFKGSPTDAIDALIEAVAPGGTVVMPAFSFDGTSLDFLRTQPVFDVRTAPARTGLLCEVSTRPTRSSRAAPVRMKSPPITRDPRPHSTSILRGIACANSTLGT